MNWWSMRSAVENARHFIKMIAHETTEKTKSSNRTILETAPNDPSSACHTELEHWSIPFPARMSTPRGCLGV